MPQLPRLRGVDHPPLTPRLLLPRGDFAARTEADLRELGIALLQGPAMSGSSWAAMEVARRWDGPVSWGRPGLLPHLADLASPLFPEGAPRTLQQAPASVAVDIVLRRLRRDRALLVLDDLDDALPPPPAPAEPQEAELALLLRSLQDGALADSGAAVLLVSRRSPAGLELPLRPLPPLDEADVATLSGRAPQTLPRSWARRPGLLALLRHLPSDAPLPDEHDPLPELVTALAEHHLDPFHRELLVTLAVVRAPTKAAALAAAGALPEERVRPGLLGLCAIGLALRSAAGYRCPRYVAEVVLRVLPEDLPGLAPSAIEQRLAGWLARTGQEGTEAWTHPDQAITSRRGLRHAARAGDAKMAVQIALHAGSAAALDRLGAWRHLRDDLLVALAAPPSALPPAELARGWYACGRVARLLGDYAQADGALRRALSAALDAGIDTLVWRLHLQLGRGLLLDGAPEDATSHLRAGLITATALGDQRAQADLGTLLAGAQLELGEIQAAGDAFASSLRLYEELDDPRRGASSKAGLAGVALYQGELRRAATLLEEASEAGLKLADREGAAQRLLNLAVVRLAQGDPRRAMAAIGRGMGAAPTSARTRSRLLGLRADLRRLAGDLDGAEADLTKLEAGLADARDRESVSEWALGRGRLALTRGAFRAAPGHLDVALSALAPDRDEALRAGRLMERWHAEAWAAAADQVAGRRGALSWLLKAKRELQAASLPIDERPFFPRFLAARVQLAEVELLTCTVAGTAPMGLLRRLDELQERAGADEERCARGEPGLRLLRAWAHRLCGKNSEAASLAKRAALDAGLQGIATIRGRALVLCEPAKTPQPWNAQALLLGRLLGR